MELSIVIPAYNEAQKIERDLQAAEQFLDSYGKLAEVLVVNDGSQDNTAERVRSHIQQHANCSVRLVDYTPNRGKGHAVRAGIAEAKGNVIAFADAGLCVPYSCLNLGILKLSEGYDLAIGNRKHAKTRIVQSQPLYRRWGSRVFHGVVRTLMGIPKVSDTQCGFKVYRREAAKNIFDSIQTKGFMFDIEALILAKKLGLRIGEFPVDWKNDSDTRYHPVWGTLRNLKELVRIRAGVRI